MCCSRHNACITLRGTVVFGDKYKWIAYMNLLDLILGWTTYLAHSWVKYIAQVMTHSWLIFLCNCLVLPFSYCHKGDIQGRLIKWQVLPGQVNIIEQIVGGRPNNSLGEDLSFMRVCPPPPPLHPSLAQPGLRLLASHFALPSASFALNCICP